MLDTDQVAVVVTHRTRPGQRDAVRTIWKRLMAPAVEHNDGHLGYYYCLDMSDADVVTAFQLYRSSADAAAFLETEAYRAYEREVTPLLVQPPRVQRLSLDWMKS